MSHKLTRKQVLALSRALKRHGRKLPKLSVCARVGKVTGHRLASEVCHYKDGYYLVGSTDRWSRDARRGDLVRKGKSYKRVAYDREGYASGYIAGHRKRRA